MRHFRQSLSLCALTLSVLTSLAACGGGSGGSGAQVDAPELVAASAPTPSIVLSDEPWSFGSTTGSLVTTPHYRLFTTERNPTTRSRLAPFVELSLMRYQDAFGGLPEPDRHMETFLMANRREWVALTGKLLGARAQPLMSIRRGGFALNGRALLFDVGVHDTFALLAHEGWHQYTQTAFRDRLPPWAEEGIATTMEGFRWVGPSLDRPDFRAWANRERYDQLRRVMKSGELLPLAMLVSVSPGELLDDTKDAALVYYAQVWALILFLEEGEGGRYRDGLHGMVRDAASGRIAIETRARLIEKGGAPETLRRYGGYVFGAYVATDLERIEREFRAFIEQAIGPGSAQAVFAGRSPISDSN